VHSRRFQLDVAVVQPADGIIVCANVGTMRYLHIIRQGSRTNEEFRWHWRGVNSQGTRQVFPAGFGSAHGWKAVGISDDWAGEYVGGRCIDGRRRGFLWRRRRAVSG